MTDDDDPKFVEAMDFGDAALCTSARWKRTMTVTWWKKS